jgi:hypothetical protein
VPAATVATLSLLFLAASASAGRAQDTETPKLDVVLRAGIVDAHPGDAGGVDFQGPSVTAVSAGFDVQPRPASLGGAWDIRFDLSFDRQPRFVMTKPSSSAVAAGYASGLGTSLALWLAHTSGPSEIAVVGRAGAARLDADANVVSNDIGQTAAFFDALVDFRWYRGGAPASLHNSQRLMPAAHTYAGVRHDQRFHRAGDLAGFDDPTGRVILAGELSVVRIADRRAGAGGATLFTVDGGVEFERALRGAHPMPSGFRVFVRGNLDCLRALRRKSSPA